MADLFEPAERQLAEYHPRVLRFFVARGCQGASEDLAAEVVVRVLAVLRRGVVPEHAGAYALGVAKLVLLEHLRDKSREPVSMPEGWEPAAPQAEEPDAERLGLLDTCLKVLDPVDRDLLVRYHGEGKNKEIRARLAEQLGVTLNAVGVRVCRLRAQVRDCMERRAVK